MLSEQTPVPGSLEIEPAKLDRENAFLLYATFCGDVVRTAAALGITPGDVIRIAEEEHWTKQLKPIIDLKNSGRPGDIERAVNRALNFVQAHRMRLFLERVLRRIIGMSPAELEEYMLEEKSSRKGTGMPIVYKKLSTRALADLASAMEKTQALTYMALNDTAQERIRRNDDQPGGSASDMHLAISKAFAEVRSSNSPRAQLFDAQLSVAQEVVALQQIKEQGK